MDTITYRFEGRNHYVLTAIDLNIRAKPLTTKHTKYTARALLEIIENVERLRAKALSSSTNNNSKIPITILSDNGSEFHKEFEAIIVEKRLEHLRTYPNVHSLR